jgi:hypothetical protein
LHGASQAEWAVLSWKQATQFLLRKRTELFKGTLLFKNRPRLFIIKLGTGPLTLIIEMLKSVVLRIFAPVVRTFMIVGFSIIGFKQVRFGRHRFFGPGDKTREFERAVIRLAEMDTSLYQELLDVEALYFWYSKQKVVDERISRTYGVAEEFFAWKEHGIITMVVYAHFLTKHLGKKLFSKADALRRHDEVRLTTLSWLRNHEFPDALSELFRTRAS